MNWKFSKTNKNVKFFVDRVSGPPLEKNEIIMAITWTGVYFVDDQEQVSSIVDGTILEF